MGEITVPLAYLYADPGTLFSPKLADWYREHVHTPYKSSPFPGSTHMLVTDAPERFVKVVDNLIKR